MRDNKTRNSETVIILPEEEFKKSIRCVKASACFKPTLYYSAMALNTFYAVAVSLLFASFAYRRAEGNLSLGVFYALCTFSINVLVALVFSENAIASVKRLGKKETAFILSFILGFALSVGPTAAGLEIAKEAAEGFPFIANSPTLTMVATIFSSFNTWTTRFVGSVYLIHSVINGVRHFMLRRQSDNTPLYRFYDDIQRYGARVDTRNDLLPGENMNVQQLKTYAHNLYTEMRENGYRSGNSYSHYFQFLAKFMVSTAIVAVLIINMMPLWIQLAVRGTETFSKRLSESKAFIMYAAVASELFYLNSGRQFVSTLMLFISNAYTNVMKKYHQYSPNKVRGVFVVGIGSFLAVWAIAAYFSGMGYGEDALESMNCSQNTTTNFTTTCQWPEGFGPMPQKLWFSWMGFWTVLFAGFYDKIATMSAGSIVNGKAFLNFCLTRIPLLKTDETTSHYKAKEAMESYIETFRISELKEDKSAPINLSNKLSKIQQECNKKNDDDSSRPFSSSLWDFFCCKKPVNDGEELPLTRNSTVQRYTTS